MKEYFKIAWRNLWRNKKRTLITVASVFFAVFLALFMRSMQLGSYDAMEYNTVKNTTGYIQIHAPGYWDDKTINNIFSNDGILQEVEKLDNISQCVPRLESFALGSSGSQTKGIAVIGTAPEMENEASGLKKRLIEGQYLEKGDDGVLIVVNLAKFLQLGVGDTVTLISQGYHGVTAAGVYPVRGIISFPSTTMNNKLLYMDIEQAQFFYGAPDMLTSISIMLHDTKKLASDTLSIRETIGPDYEIMEWREMNPEVVQGIESDNISGMFMLGILYVVVGFGILGTMMMMTLERKREFGVMVSVGMQRYKLGIIVFIETLFIGFIGVISGIIASIPLIYYFYLNPIRLSDEMAEAMLEMNMEPVMPFSMDLPIFYNQAIVVLVLTLFAVIYPLVFVHRFKVLKAISGR